MTFAIQVFGNQIENFPNNVNKNLRMEDPQTNDLFVFLRCDAKPQPAFNSKAIINKLIKLRKP